MLRTLGVLTLLSTALVPVVALIPEVLEKTQFEAPIFFGALIGMAGGLLVMIGHMNLTSTVPNEEKTMWRRHLWWAGPVAAGLYLWRAGRSNG
jgi:hypothetical protein